MTLQTKVTDRFGTTSPFLINLTNHDDGDATTINDTRLGHAVADVGGDFLVEAQRAYDETLAEHVNAAVEGVVAYLRMYSSAQGKAGPEMDRFHERLRRLGKIDARKRISPSQGKRARGDGDEDNFLGMSPEYDEVGERD